jgi:CHAT domain-containing protein/ketosteroid isomerase-like protein
MRPLVSRLALIFFLLVLVSVTSGSHQTNDEALIHNIVERYFAAYAGQDVDAMSRLWSDKSAEFEAHRKTLEKFFSENDSIHIEIDYRRVETSGDSAVVCVSVDINATQKKTGDRTPGFGRRNWSLHLIKESTGWKISKQEKSEVELAALLVSATNEKNRQTLLDADKDLQNVELCKALIARSRSLAEASNYSDALSAAQLATSIAERISDTRSLIDAASTIGGVYLLRGDLNASLQSYQQAEKLAESGNYPLAELQANLCSVQQRLGNFDQATQHCQRSLSLAQSAGNKVAAANTLNTLGIISRQRGAYPQAFEYYHQSLAIFEALGDKRGIAKLLNNLGVAYNAIGNATEALQCYLRSIPIAEEIGNKSGVAGTLSNVSMIYRTLGNYKLALESSQRSFDISEAIGDKTSLSSSLEEIGKIHVQAGEYAAALDCYRKSLAVAEQTGEKLDIAIRLLSVGNGYLNLGDSAAALDYYKRGLSLAESMDAPFTVVAILNRLAHLSLQLGRAAEALELSERSVEKARQTGAHKDYWQGLLIAGEAFRSLKKPEEARKRFEEAINVIETARSQLIANERDQAFFFESRFDPYAQMVLLMAEQGQAAEAFNFSERSKARILLDVLQAGRVDINSAMNEQEKGQENKLRTDLNSLNGQVRRESQSSKSDPKRLADLKDRVEKARLAHENFQTQLYASHPELRVKRGQSLPLDLAQANELVTDSRTALLEYAVAGDKTFLFVITSNNESGNEAHTPKLNLYDLNIDRQQLIEQVRKFNRSIANNDLEYSTLSKELYGQLVAPAEKQLRGKNRLIIVPDDILWEAPFQALKSADGRFLIESAAVSYTPSLTVLREVVKLSKPRSDGPMLAMGNPKLAGPTISRAKDVMSGSSFEPLPEAERMVTGLGRLYGSSARVYVGTEAREDIFKLQAANYRILQLSTHGVINDRSPMYSHLVLAQSGDGKEDGLLEAWEIMQMKLNADLVVLSACETARGRVGAGEGVIGLSWALFVAGCPTTVVSQWKVESSSTADLMLEFHRHLLKGESKSESMRRAALKLMADKRFSHPFYWAGFIVVGNGN